MIEKARELLKIHGKISVPFLQRNLKCTVAVAKKIKEELDKDEPMDHSLPLNEFIEKYKGRFNPCRTINRGFK